MSTTANASTTSATSASKHAALDLFVSRGLYGPRTWTHFDAYRMAPGWFWVEVGSVTVEVTCMHSPRVVFSWALGVAACVPLVWLLAVGLVG